MGSKFQKKSNNSPFKGKEKITVVRAVRAINTHITIMPCGTFTSEDIITTTVGMALNRNSPTSICRVPDLKFPSCTTYHACTNSLEYVELEENNSKLFQEFAHQFLDKGKYYTFAIDEVNDPYYGKKVPENEDFIVGGKQKKSTNHFYSYISLYVTIRNRRVTLAVFPVRKSQSKCSSIKRFIEIIREEGYHIRVLLLDRGFYSAEIFHYLQSEGIPHIMPVKVYGKKLKELLNQNELRQFEYTIYEDSKKPQTIKIIRYLYRKITKDGTIEEKNRGFVYFGLEWSLLKIKSEYRTRFAIESSYRMRNIVRPRTSTRDPVIRYFFTIVSFLLKNIWVVILHENFRRKQRGPIVIISDWFRFEAFIGRMWNAIAKLASNTLHLSNFDEIT
ncbi:transposase [Methanospirillum stamsii]|uniref:ISH3 family transposase n=1 Tax=Methanospirillum stamsii TaxID=1277351 RepID=A0A2V2NK38_9EURY|nr:transposase [Methanospirillum stamsii]PWR75703.1 ISH3 family transposase [Methanospirillum stamsii]